jgi:hypothetical protein
MRYLTATLRFVLILVAALITALSIYSYTSADEIKNYLLKEINQQLLVQADVKEVEISLFQNFPNLSLILSQVHMHQGSKSIIKAEELRVKFSLFDLLDQKFELHSLAIKGGQLELIEDENGRFFPKIWNSDSEADEQQKISFELKLRKVSLSNIKLHYAEKNVATEFNLLVRSAWLKGKFGQDKYELAWNSSIENFTFFKKGKAAFENQAIRLESICKINEPNQKLSIELLEIDWLNLRLNAKGSLDYTDQVYIDLRFSDRATSMDNYFPLLDKKLVRELDSLDFSANLKIDGTFKGELSPQFHPSVDLAYEIENGRFKDAGKKLVLESLKAKGTYSNPDLSKFSNGEFKADTLNGTLNGMRLNGKLNWFTSSRFPIRAELELYGELSQLNPFLDSLPFRLEKGAFEAKFEGYFDPPGLEKFDLKEWKSAEKSLYVLVKDAKIFVSDSFPPIRILNGEFALGKNDLFARSLEFEVDGMSLNYQGPILNLISFIDNESETLLIDGKARSENLDIERILALFKSNGEPKNIRDYRFKIYIDAEVKRLKYQKLDMHEAKFNMNATNSRWMFENVSMNTLEGKLNGDLLFSEQSEANWLMYNRSDFIDLDIHQLFEVFDNFGQDEIKAEHLYGKASGNLELECLIVNGKIDKKSINSSGYFDIQNGRLKAYESLYQLSKYIELEELKDIRFNRLQNQFQIQNENIYLPRFSVRSSAIDLEIEGNHTFDNEVDYQISLSLAQVLGKKVKKPQDTEFGYIEDDGLGKTRLFLRMVGDLSNPDIKYDKEQLKDHWKSEVKKEKQTIKSILKQEFGMFKKDTTLSSPAKENNSSAPFQIEWGENEKKEETPKPSSNKSEENGVKKDRKKGKFGKFIDKIAKPNEEEYVYPED